MKTCEETTKQIIWSTNCENTVQNSAFENTLKGMDSEVLTAVDQFCPSKGGILFWTGHLTAEQIELIKKEVNIVKAVEPDIKLDTLMTLDRKKQQQAENPAAEKDFLAGKIITDTARSKRSNFFLAKRDIVMKQQNADHSLSFLSTGKGKVNSGTYSYLIPSGRTVKLFYIGPGLDVSHPEFRNLHGNRVRWLYALDSDPRRRDSHPRGHGSCIASILAGGTFGVARGLSTLTAVKIGSHVSSLLDALRTVFLRLETDWVFEDVRGYTVIYLPYGSRELSQNQHRNTRFSMHRLIERLIHLYDAVVVVPAGGNSVSSRQKMDDYPLIDTFPALIATTLPIIPVGAVHVDPAGATNGQRYPWSYGGPLLAVSAPGKGECLGGAATGTALAAAYAAGLVAYLLGLRDVGEYLRAGMGDGVMPASVRQHLRETAFSRFEGAWPVLDEEKYTIWNGLDSETVNWMGPNVPPPDPPLLKK